MERMAQQHPSPLAPVRVCKGRRTTRSGSPMSQRHTVCSSASFGLHAVVLSEFIESQVRMTLAEQLTSEAPIATCSHETLLPVAREKFVSPCSPARPEPWPEHCNRLLGVLEARCRPLPRRLPNWMITGMTHHIDASEAHDFGESLEDIKVRGGQVCDGHSVVPSETPFALEQPSRPRQFFASSHATTYPGRMTA